MAVWLLTGCASYPDVKDGKSLECWAEKPFQGGRITAVNGVMGNWINASRESSVSLLRDNRMSPENPTIEVVAQFPDPQAEFKTFALTVDGETVRALSEKSAGQDDLSGGVMTFDGRPYYRFRLGLKEIYDVSKNVDHAFIVAFDDEGVELARELIDLSGVDEKIIAVREVMDESQDMWDNQRNACKYYHQEAMPIPDPPPWY